MNKTLIVSVLALGLTSFQTLALAGKPIFMPNVSAAIMDIYEGTAKYHEMTAELHKKAAEYYKKDKHEEAMKAAASATEHSKAAYEKTVVAASKSSQY